jgi:hypothetical protein
MIFNWFCCTWRQYGSCVHGSAILFAVTAFRRRTRGAALSAGAADCARVLLQTLPGVGAGCLMASSRRSVLHTPALVAADETR